MKEHIKKLRKELTKRGLDAFLSFHNTRYLAGTTAAKAVIIPMEGDPILVCSRLEMGRAKRDSWIKDIRAFSRWRAPLAPGERVSFCEWWQLLADCLREIDARAVGHDGATPGLIRKLLGAHEAGYLGFPELMMELRKVKSRKEVAMLRKAAAIAVKGMRCAGESIAVGRTELEIAAEAEREMRVAGSEGTPFPTIVASGGNSWLPHAGATRKRLRRRELVIVDLGATFQGYCSDMTRTFALSPTEKQLTLVELAGRAQRAALARVRSGAKASDVDKAARGVISRAGYAKFSPHGTGHGIGMGIHEPPGLSPDSKDILREGMVITVEPGVYVPGVGGARLEDVILVKVGGYELLATVGGRTHVGPVKLKRCVAVRKIHPR